MCPISQMMRLPSPIHKVDVNNAFYGPNICVWFSFRISQCTRFTCDKNEDFTIYSKEYRTEENNSISSCWRERFEAYDVRQMSWTSATSQDASSKRPSIRESKNFDKCLIIQSDLESLKISQWFHLRWLKICLKQSWSVINVHVIEQFMKTSMLIPNFKSSKNKFRANLITVSSESIKYKHHKPRKPLNSIALCVLRWINNC